MGKRRATKVPRTHQITKKRRWASFILQILELIPTLTITDKVPMHPSFVLTSKLAPIPLPLVRLVRFESSQMVFTLPPACSYKGFLLSGIFSFQDHEMTVEVGSTLSHIIVRCFGFEKIPHGGFMILASEL